MHEHVRVQRQRNTFLTKQPQTIVASCCCEPDCNRLLLIVDGTGGCSGSSATSGLAFALQQVSH